MDNITLPACHERAAIRWIFVGSANLTLGLLLWFGFLTDYSWAGILADILFPPAAGVVGLACLYLTMRAKMPLSAAFCLPSLIGGGLSIFFVAIIILPPFTLGIMFTAGELENEKKIQEAASPDGTRIAEVYLRGVGAYTGGNGRVYVRVKHRWLPFAERDIYHLNRSLASEDSHDYLHWLDNDTLSISETQREIRVGFLESDTPTFLNIAFFIISLGWRLFESAIRPLPI